MNQRIVKCALIFLTIIQLWIYSQESFSYEPPSDDQLTNWWAGLSQQERLIELRKLDILENTPLTMENFAYGALLTTEGDLIIFPEKEVIQIKLDYLEYELELPTSKITDFQIPESEDNIVFTVLACSFCVMAGITIGLLL
jgi:hypothetical protein